MDYDKYKNSRDMAWKLLIKHKVNSLPVKISTICKQENILLVNYERGIEVIKKAGLESQCVENDGFLYRIGSRVLIFYNPQCSIGRQRFTVAHELGHYYLGHTGKLINREMSPNDSSIEQAANVFASRILAPSCVLWGLGVQTAGQIAELCNISPIAAKFRMERMAMLFEREREFVALRGRSCFLMSSLERQVYNQFESYIKTHRL